jgi:trehalose 6-phosphate synthase/phosphatase
MHWSAGGLATGLRGLHERGDSRWIGWPGLPDTPPEDQRATIDAALARLRCEPVYLPADELRAAYEEVANGVLWPAFHYHLDRLPTVPSGWDGFRAVNERFAEAVARNYRGGDIIWIHDYQLCLAPAMIRRLLPDAPIGFFLHVPFPSSEVFSVLPWREEILAGILGADLAGFHTASYLRHFTTALRRCLGLDVEIDRVAHAAGETHLGVFPMGVDVRAWSEIAARDDVVANARRVRDESPTKQILLGIDRLDYTKGIPRRVVAMDQLLRTAPELRGAVRLIQVTVPSRENVESYAQFTRELDELVGRVNATWATEHWVPIHHLHRALDQAEIAALYRAADVMLVTPVRDGMNLVAKEFIASREDGDGVLILSEFAGAAAELGAALHVNPYDIEAMANTIRSGLSLPVAERRCRMNALRAQIASEHDVSFWAGVFTQRLESVAAQRREADCRPRATTASALLPLLPHSDPLVVALDYDGTLVPLASTPDRATPDAGLILLLEALARRPQTDVHILSGRPRATLERWLGGLNIGLHAEHGMWSRFAGSAQWVQHGPAETGWKGRVRPILESFTRATPGSFVEEKEHSLAWHYRLTAEDYPGGSDFGERQAKELRLLLLELLGRSELTVLPGNRVVEVRPVGVHKGMLIPRIMERLPGARVLAIGDDTTDEDLFRAVPPGSVTVRVGGGTSAARLRVEDFRSVRSLLGTLCEQSPAAAGYTSPPSPVNYRRHQPRVPAAPRSAGRLAGAVQAFEG